MSDAAHKVFDSVEMMRSIRQRITSQIAGMTIEEEVDWLRSHEFSDVALKSVMARTAPQSDLGGAAERRR